MAPAEMSEFDKERAKIENPQAFPQEWTLNGTTDNWENGMTLRDYFAARYLQANANNVDYIPEDLANHAYEVADAMLKERTKTQ